MAVNFTTLRAKLIAAIHDNATHVVNIVKINVTTADATKPHRVTAAAPTLYPTDVICADEDMPDEGIPARNVIIPGDVGVVPDTNMRVRFADGKEFSIVALSTYDQGGVNIGYKARVESWPASSTQRTQ